MKRHVLSFALGLLLGASATGICAQFCINVPTDIVNRVVAAWSDNWDGTGTRVDCAKRNIRAAIRDRVIEYEARIAAEAALNGTQSQTGTDTEPITVE